MTPLEQAEEAFRRPTYDRWTLDEFWWLSGMLKRLPEGVRIRFQTFDLGRGLGVGFQLGDKSIAILIVRAPVPAGWVGVYNKDRVEVGRLFREAKPGYHAGEISQEQAAAWEVKVRNALGLEPPKEEP